MIKKKIIFVGGIHGVGKTTFCKKVSKSLELESFSSGDLISRFKSSERDVGKRVYDIQANQHILSNAVKEFMYEDKDYLLDGHFCLINKNNSISRVPLSAFESLDLRGITILTDDEKDILKRLKERDDIDYSLEFIKKFQEKEITYGKYVADKLGIPLRVIDISQEYSTILSMIRELFPTFPGKSIK